MAMQNLVSAEMDEENLMETLKCLDEVERRLGLVTSLGRDEMRSLFKAGKEYTPIFDKAFLAMSQHPEIIPSAFPTEEFKKDYKLFKDLAPIVARINQLAESMQKTMTALASDTLVESVEIYHLVKQHEERIPGLMAVAKELSVYFARPRKGAGGSKAAASATAR